MRTSSRSPLRWLRGVMVLSVLVGAVAALRGVQRRRPAMEPVAADLRSPLLYVPMSLRSARMLRVLRSLPSPEVGLAPGVSVESRTIPTDEGHQLRVLVYERTGRVRPSGALLWVHGGGTVFGRPEQGHALCSR